jgi:thiol-disulfide isomerase/thioredoxin
VRRALLPLLALLLIAADGAPARPEGAAVGSGFDRIVNGTPLAPPVLDVSLVNDQADMPDLDSLVTRTTVLFYFSATCPHCQEVAPELAELAKRRTDVDFVGIASGANGLTEITAFAKTYGLTFPMYKDFARKFASANQGPIRGPRSRRTGTLAGPPAGPATSRRTPRGG